MHFMNAIEIDDAAQRFASHPVLGPATATLVNLRDAADANSDGWCYWPKPARAADKLMTLIEGASYAARYGDRTDATVEALRKAYAPLKALRTRTGLSFEIVAA